MIIGSGHEHASVVADLQHGYLSACAWEGAEGAQLCLVVRDLAAAVRAEDSTVGREHADLAAEDRVDEGLSREPVQ